MKTTKRIIKRNGETEIRFSLVVSDKELEGVERIREETYNIQEELRTKDHDWFLTVLRLLTYYVDMFNHATQRKTDIIGNINRRKNRESKPRKKDRVRTKRNKVRKTKSR